MVQHNEKTVLEKSFTEKGHWQTTFFPITLIEIDLSILKKCSSHVRVLRDTFKSSQM